MKIFISGNEAYTSFSKKLENLGIGVKRGGRIYLHPVEVMFLVLKYKAQVISNGKVLDFVDVFDWCAKTENFMPIYCTYEDLRSRGYKVKIVEDVLVYKYVFIPIEEICKISIKELSSRRYENTVLAVVDEENELTYYKFEEVDLRGQHEEEDFEVSGVLIGDRIFTDEFLHKRYFYGSLKGDKTILSLLEGAYLLEKGWLEVYKRGKRISYDELVETGCKFDPEFKRKLEVYKDLKLRKFIVKTGLKFGSDFRLYEYLADKLPHSKYLVTIVDDKLLPMFEVVRAVRLAHSVRKKAIFVYKYGERNIYMSIERIKV